MRSAKRARLDISTQHSPLSQSELTLRKYALDTAIKLANIGNWELFVDAERGPADIAGTVRSLPHKAARLLEHLRRRGAGVPLHTPPWSAERIQMAAQRGSHRSAKNDVEFVCAEMLDFCAQGYWIVLPLEAALLLPGLRLSPLGVVPQRNRRSRLIVDYTHSGVNEETVRLAPPEAMQFGKALQRILAKIVHVDPSYGPVYLAKIDIADGFYRIAIRSHDVPRLGVILPTSDGSSPPRGATPGPAYGLGGEPAVFHLGHRDRLRFIEYKLAAVGSPTATSSGVPRSNSTISRHSMDAHECQGSAQLGPRGLGCSTRTSAHLRGRLCRRLYIGCADQASSAPSLAHRPPRDRSGPPAPRSL